ncbi:protein kinase domain-containing protein [Actinoallomurus sp. CA-150999]|uniref:protein kinase domain-containing protein n=1 Tax=Actinoallomurus sp. CA-150999 TaxID=3239887 RepID=UPI003D907E77
MSIAPPAPDAAEEWPENNPPMRLGFCKPIRVRRGGMGLVYLCEREEMNDQVAVKRLNAELSSIPGVAETFLHECYLWLQLGRHPNVTTALSAHRVPQEPPHLVLEYVPRSLRDIITDRRIGLAEAVRVLIGVTDGLAHARERLPGFVHADLKPENILVGADETAKITDLGLARTLRAAAHTNPAYSYEGGGGTPLYMAPEQILQGAPTEAGDIYAIGCVAHELVAGEPTYGRPQGVEDYLLRHLHRDAVPLDRLRKDTPAELARLVTEMLAKNANARPGLDHVRTTLRAIAEMLGCPVPIPDGEDAVTGDRLMAAQGLLNLGYYDEALQMARRLIAESGGDAEIHGRILIARAQVEHEEYEEATSELNRVAELLDDGTSDTLRAMYWTERMRVAGNGEDPAVALEYAVEAMHSAPRSSVVYANAAVLFARLGKLDEAIQANYAALSIAGNLGYFTGLANLLHEAGRPEEGLEVCDRLVAYHSALGVSYAFRGLFRIMIAHGAIDAEQIRLIASDLKTALHLGPPDLEQIQVLRTLVESMLGPDWRSHTG